MPLNIILNGEPRSLSESGAKSVTEFVAEAGIVPDRVAIERNGVIVPRRLWSETPLAEGDRLEMVHFVGGGLG